VHVSNALNVNNGVETVLVPTTLAAGRHLTLGLLETIGDVTLSAATGNVVVTQPLGAPVPVLPPANNLWNAAGVGINSLTVNAPGAGAVISLQGARSVGNVSLTAPGGLINSAFAVTSSAGTVNVVTAAPPSISATPIPAGLRLSQPAVVAPAISPGPLRAEPPGPLIPAAPAPGAPGLPEILVSAPQAIDAGALAVPGQAGGGADGAAEQAANAARSSTAAANSEGTAGEASGTAAPAAGQAAGAPVVIFGGGRGAAQSADLGRSGNYGRTSTPAAESEDDKRKRRAAPVPVKP
jgi:hypothetical protein